MFLGFKKEITQRICDLARDIFGVQIERINAEAPPHTELGDLAFPVAFDLAKKLKKKPRDIAEELRKPLAEIPGVQRVEVAGAGYLNFYFDRSAYLEKALRKIHSSTDLSFHKGKVLIEHTNINPNKAAHVGHLRNAVLGDTLVRILRFLGQTVEVQNYVDDTGVQLADVVVGFIHLEGKKLDGIQALSGKFDDYCWDLYSRVHKFYEGDAQRLALRDSVMKEIEAGQGEAAKIGAFVAQKIVRCHLATMKRIGIGYDLLVWEGDILRRRFWEKVFAQLKEIGAVYYAAEGKNQGCWVMKLEESEEFANLEEPDKILVRSNGTVTYVGKDIAYQMWKFGLLGEDFFYAPYEFEGKTLYTTSSEPASGGGPGFGSASVVYNVIDVRQSYLQAIVAEALRSIGYEDAARNSIHFAYEMVALTPGCLREMNLEVPEGQADKAYIGMEGRRGIGVKADHLLDVLEEMAAEEVRSRNPEFSTDEVKQAASILASACLRYFIIKYTRNKVVAFDFKEVLNFEGETGAYILNAGVRARSIFRKLKEREGIGIPDSEENIDAILERLKGSTIPDDQWELILLLSKLSECVLQGAQTLELSVLAKYSFLMAQKFHSFYHKYRILGEAESPEKWLRVCTAFFFLEQMKKTLELLGIELPARM